MPGLAKKAALAYNKRDGAAPRRILRADTPRDRQARHVSLEEKIPDRF